MKKIKKDTIASILRKFNHGKEVNIFEGNESKKDRLSFLDNYTIPQIIGFWISMVGLSVIFKVFITNETAGMYFISLVFPLIFVTGAYFLLKVLKDMMGVKDDKETNIKNKKIIRKSQDFFDFDSKVQDYLSKK